MSWYFTHGNSYQLVLLLGVTLVGV